MFDLFKKIMPKEEKFFDMFERHAACIVAASLTLREILDGGAGAHGACARLMKQEDEADAIGAEVNLALRKSFITPFDRTDIKTLISSMDDAIDQMNKTAKAVLLYEVAEFEPGMRELGDEIVKLAALAKEAVPHLRNIGKNAARLHEITGQIIDLEEESDHVHDAGIKALLKGKGRKDPMAFIVGQEIYGHLEKVADRFEDVANVIGGIVIEHH
jgi:uncharacterized protein